MFLINYVYYSSNRCSETIPEAYLIFLLDFSELQQHNVVCGVHETQIANCYDKKYLILSLMFIEKT